MNELVTVELRPLGRTIDAVPGTPLSDVLVGCGVEFPCGGRGRCGRCRVRVISGDLAVTADQADILSPSALANGWRLACRTTAEVDSIIEVAAWTTPVLVDDTRMDFEPRPGRGIAVDLGTTTLVAQLLDLTTGQVLAVETALNPQAARGTDLMARIEFAIEGGQAELVGLIRTEVGNLIDRLLLTAGPGPDDDPGPDSDPAVAETAEIADIVIVGNTVMHHLFCDLDLEPLSRVPFQAGDDAGGALSAEALGWQLPGDPAVRFGPDLGGFVGSDLVAGILATGLHERRELCALIDLGTNGEIILGNRDHLLCASAAAGPAFEAGGVAMGMQATTGAISEVTIEQDGFACRVLGGGEARGICGSGLVDAVAAGLDLGLIEPSGRLTDSGSPLDLVDGVSLRQSDIRQLQLAKGAIAAGLTILRRAWHDPDAELERVYLAGAFGNYVSRRSARRIGLIDAPVERIEPVGNTALLGAKIAMFAGDRSDILAAISSRTDHISLAADPCFQDVFVDEMTFRN